MVSLIPIVNGDGPREPSPTPAVRNSRLPTLSARAIVAGDTRPARICSERRDGGRGMAMELPDVGVGIWRLFNLLKFADPGADALISPTSENISPRSAYRLLEKKDQMLLELSMVIIGCFTLWNSSTPKESDFEVEHKDELLLVY